jgi:hypothetical protein
MAVADPRIEHVAPEQKGGWREFTVEFRAWEAARGEPDIWPALGVLLGFSRIGEGHHVLAHRSERAPWIRTGCQDPPSVCCSAAVTLAAA